MGTETVPSSTKGIRMKRLMIVRLGMIAGLCPRLAWFLGLMLLAII